MTGDEHYKAAEALLDLAETEPEGSSLTAEYLAAAQVHAALAQASAIGRLAVVSMAPWVRPQVGGASGGGGPLGGGGAGGALR